MNRSLTVIEHFGMKNFAKKIGHNLKMQRLTYGIQQRQLADMSGYCLNSIQQFERGVTCPKIDTLFVLAHCLRCEARDLLPY